jgi:APA family basic amino acid/polyamine antiporter
MGLKKAIGKKTLLFIVINAILGTGIFFLPALGAAYAGTASILSWIAMSLIAVLIACYFAELVSMFPKSGGIYEYTKIFGKFPSFMVGWLSWIIANITIAMLIVGSLLYLFPSSSILFYAAASVSAILFFNTVSYMGIKNSARLLLFFGLMTIATLLILILPGSFFVDLTNFSPFVISPLMIFLAMYVISETFFGWESSIYLAEEIKDAKRVLPKILVTATVIIALISIALVFVFLGIVTQSGPAPLVTLAAQIFGSDFSKIFAIVIFLPLIGTAATWIISSPRLLFAMSRDKVMVTSFRKIHKKYRTPHNAIIFQTIASSIITVVAFANYDFLLKLLVPLVIITYSFMLLAVTKLRMKRPEIKRHFTAPFGKVGPVLIILFNLLLLSVWIMQPGSLSTFAMSLLLMSFGIPLYVMIMLQTDRQFIEKFFDRISFLWDRLFPIWYGRHEVTKVINKIKIKQGPVLDFGCGSGITTLELAKRGHTIVAVDLSKKQLSRAVGKINKAMKLSNVIFIKERGLAPFERHSFDAIVAVGVLSHLDNPKKTLKKLFEFLKPGGYFSFLTFGKSFGITGSDCLCSRNNINNIFKELGIKPRIKREKKRMSEYWYIWGQKPTRWKI